MTIDLTNSLLYRMNHSKCIVSRKTKKFIVLNCIVSKIYRRDKNIFIYELSGHDCQTQMKEKAQLVFYLLFDRFPRNRMVEMNLGSIQVKNNRIKALDGET